MDTAESLVTAGQVLWDNPILRPILERIRQRLRGDGKGRDLPFGMPTEAELRQRYRDVFVGFEQVGTWEHIMGHLVPFEEALADLEICTACRATEVQCLSKDDRSPARQFVVADCGLAAHGHGSYYYALSVATYRVGRPVFAYYNCGGPLERTRTLAERWKWKGGDEP